MQQNKLHAALFALLCVALWGLIPVVAKFGQTDLDSQQFLFWSSLLSFLIMLLISVLTGKWRSFKTYRVKDWLLISGNGFLGTFLYYLLLYQGYKIAGGVEVLVTQYTWPVLICLLSVVILKERWNLNKTLAVLFGFAAVLLVLSKGNIADIRIQEPVAILWVLVGAASFALFSVLSKKFTYEPVSLTCIYFLVALVASSVLLVSDDNFAVPSSDSLFSVLVNGLLVNGVSYLFWMWALKKAEASFVTPFTFATPLISLGYLMVFFDEPFLLVYGVAFGLIVLAGFFANR